MDELEKIAVSQLVFPIIKDLIIPKIKSTYEKYFPNEQIEELQVNFEDYLSARYNKFLIIDTLVFPNKQTFFKILYEPLTIVQQKNYENREIKIDSFPQKLLEENYRILIEDTAGMGKSTIIKKLFLSLIEEHTHIPFLIELRQLNETNTIIKELNRQLTLLGKSLNEGFLMKLIKEGGFVFLFDGYDEISQKDKRFVINELKSFMESFSENYFIMTSRKEDSLASFGDFQKFHVKPLTIKESYNLIRRYDGYSHNSFGEDLIKQLTKNHQKALKEYLENPFLVSLIFKSYEHKKDIPLKKSQFYRQVFDALFEAHDLSKEGYLKRDKFSNLHLDDFERVLRVVGYLTAIENKIEYEKDYIVKVIDKAREILFDLNFKSTDFLKDLLETVPLFKKDGNYHKWSHKSLQDYFAAKFIWIDAKENAHIILNKIYNSQDNKRFYNVLDIYYEIDPIAFEENIVFKLAEQVTSYDTEAYINLESVSEEDILIRKQGHFGKNCSIVRMLDSEIDEAEGITDEVFDKYAKLIEHDWGIAHHHTIDNTIWFLAFIEFIPNMDTILDITAEKYPSLVTHFDRNLDEADIKELYILPEGIMYRLNDEKDNILNSPKLFSTVSKIVNDRYCINIKALSEKFRSLKNRVADQKKNDLLDW